MFCSLSASNNYLALAIKGIGMKIHWLSEKPKNRKAVFMACDANHLLFAYCLADHIFQVEGSKSEVSFDVVILVSPGFEKKNLLLSSQAIVGELSGFDERDIPIKSNGVYDLPSGTHGLPVNAYFRFMGIPALSVFYDRVLYFDTDIRLTKPSISLLLDEAKMRHAVASAPEFTINEIAFKQLNKDEAAYYKELAIPESAIYRNSGVLLIDAKKFSQESIWERMVDVSRKYGNRFKWLDQSLLNKTLHSEMDLMSPAYNWQVNSLSNVKFIGEVSIMHIHGEKKPWLTDELGKPYYLEFYDSYIQFCEENKVEVPNSNPCFAGHNLQKSKARQVFSQMNRMRKVYIDRKAVGLSKFLHRKHYDELASHINSLHNVSDVKGGDSE